MKNKLITSYFSVLLLVWVVFISEAMGFTVIFKTNANIFGQHQIMGALPIDLVISSESTIEGGTYDIAGATGNDPLKYTCIKTYPNRYNVSFNVDGGPQLTEARGWVPDANTAITQQLVDCAIPGAYPLAPIQYSYDYGTITTR